MRTLLVVLVVLVLLGAGADRVAHRLATGEMERRLVAEGVVAPEVEVAGFPFLDQLLSRRFDEVRVRGQALQTVNARVERLRATAFDVRAPAGGTVTLGEVSGRVDLTYDEVLRVADTPGLRLNGTGDRGEVELRQDLRALGQPVSVIGRGSVRARGGRLVVRPTSIELSDGRPLPSGLRAVLTDAFGFEYPLPRLPDGMVVRGVVAGPDAFVVRLSGARVSLR